jgi:hypothetical protein
MSSWKRFALCERIIARALDPGLLREALGILSDAWAQKYRQHPETRLSYNGRSGFVGK